jgi:hypothetical protein
MIEPLHYLIYGKPPIAHGAESAWDVLAHTGNFEATQGKILHQLVPIDPFADGTPSLCVMRVEPEYFIIAQATPTQTQFVRVPSPQMKALKGDIAPWVNLFNTPPTLEPLKFAPPIVWTTNMRIATLTHTLAMVGDDMAHLFALLAGVVNSDGLWMSGYKGDLRNRLQLMQGLTLLLPEPFRYYLTFSTHSTRLPPNRPRVVFCEQDIPTTRKHMVWGDWSLQTETNALGTLFVEHLKSLWKGSLEEFVQQLAVLDNIAHHLDVLDVGLAQNCDEVARRHTLDLAVTNPKSQVTSDSILDLLNSDAPPEGELYDSYLLRLLQIALEKRNSDVMLWIAKQMDNDPLLDAKLSKWLDKSNESEPDAVYALARVRLNEQGDERWLARLHKSAKHSVDVAIASAEATTIASWLQLLAREPQRFELGDVLHEGILRATPMSMDNGTLARDLLIIAVKREPMTVLRLLDNTDFREALPTNISGAILDHHPDRIEDLATQSRELFLLAISRAADEAREVLTIGTIQNLWELYNSHANFIIAEPYRPLTLIKRLTDTARTALQNGGLQTLLVAMLVNGEDGLFREIAKTLAQDEVLAPLLLDIVRASGRSIEEMITLITTLTNENSLTPQHAANTYVALLDEGKWDEKTLLPMAEQLARLMSQYADVRVLPNALWHLVEMQSTPKNELMVKGAVKRLLANLAQVDSEEQLVKDLVRLRKATQGLQNVRNYLQTWWRETTQTQNTAQLQKIERALEGNRTLDDLRMTLSTTVGIRKQLLNKHLAEWAQDINTTYRVLKALSDGFDPENRAVAIDVQTIQRAMDNYLDELAPDVRQVLAANLKDLGELIAQMADARSKPSLIRNDDVLERQLMTGEQPPQSAIDVMKWLAGFLDGSQKNGI